MYNKCLTLVMSYLFVRSREMSTTLNCTRSVFSDLKLWKYNTNNKCLSSASTAGCSIWFLLRWRGLYFPRKLSFALHQGMLNNLLQLSPPHAFTTSNLVSILSTLSSSPPAILLSLCLIFCLTLYVLKRLGLALEIKYGGKEEENLALSSVVFPNYSRAFNVV